MSTSYWGIIGIGIRSSSIEKHLDKHKCYLEVCKQLPEEEIEEEDFNLNDFLYGNTFQNLGEFLHCICEKSDVMSWNDNGQDDSYFLYPASYPWYRTPEDPKSFSEVEEIIVDTLTKVTNLSEDDIRSLIEEINEAGCG